jgi:hypothetical protein
MFRAKELAISVRALTDLGDSWKNYDCIGIDEGQFYKDVSKLEKYDT